MTAYLISMATFVGFFMILALGPVFGIWSMQRLRRLPEALRMASGNR